MTHRERKELGIDLMGINGLNAYDTHTSSPRKAMYATQIGQAPVVSGCEPRRIMTGMELEFGKYTFDVKFPCDATVIKVLRKYTPGVGYNSIQQNPLTAIVYEDYYDPHKTVGVLVVPGFVSLHQDFGFRYKQNRDNWGKLQEGALFAKGETLVTSPAVRDNGTYGIGIEANVAFMSLPGTIEDGLHVSESFLEKTSPTIYNTLVANWGRKTFPLNLYGDEKHYKPFPDIGDKIRDDGLVFALRELDENLAIADMTPRALRQYSDVFDRPLYGKPGATVVDINVYHDAQLNPHHTPVGMDLQARKYYDAACRFYTSLMDVYNRLKARRGKRLKITPEFNRLLVEAQIYLPTMPDKRKLSRVYRLESLDEWRVEVIFETKLKPGDGFKYTDLSGFLIR